MKRILEPEVMDNAEQARAYAAADFSDSNQYYVDQLVAEFRSRLNKVVDIGCGPADIPIRLAKAVSSVKITAVDASQPMLDEARRAVEAAGLGNQIVLVMGHLPGLDLNKSFDAILSKGLLHHLPNPLVFWDEVKRLVKKEVAIYVMDLFRPESTEEARNIVETVSGDEHPLLKKDFYNSLLAAFTVDEVKEQLRKTELGHLKVEYAGTGRHLLVKGIIKGSE